MALLGFWQMAKDPGENDKQIVNSISMKYIHNPFAHARIYCELPETRYSEKKNYQIDKSNSEQTIKSMPNASSAAENGFRTPNGLQINVIHLFEVSCSVFKFLSLLFSVDYLHQKWEMQSTEL